MFLSVIVIARDGDWTPSNGTIYVRSQIGSIHIDWHSFFQGVFLVTVLCHALLATTMQRVINKLQTISVVMNLILIAATMIALPIGKHLSSERNDAKYIFTQTENFTTWPTGWAFMLAWMSPIWTIGDFDSCVHMSEEGKSILPPCRLRLTDCFQHWMQHVLFRMELWVQSELHGSSAFSSWLYSRLASTLISVPCWAAGLDSLWHR